MRICLYSGPGCGKSLLASWLFDELRRGGTHVELVQEVIKPRAYRREWPTPWGNLGIFSEQLDRERDWLESGVTHIVTDSPIFLQCYYLAARNAKPALGCLALAREWEAEHRSLNVFLERSPEIQYQQAGRYQDKKEAEAIDVGIAEFLRAEGVEVYRHDAADRAGLLEHVRYVLAHDNDDYADSPRAA